MRWNRKLVPCSTCGGDLWRPLSLIKEHNFCSRAHHTEWKRTRTGPAAGGWRGGVVDVTCSICRVSFLVRRTRGTTAKFCSRRCKAVHARTLIGPLSGNWKGFGKRALRQLDRLRRDARRALYAASDFTLEDWDRIKGEYGNKCARCGAPDNDASLTRDHIVPLSRGGNHEARNIQPLCLPCNMRKHTRIIDYLGGYEITDMALVPREFMRPNTLKILAVVQEMRGATSIPGIEAVLVHPRTDRSS